MGTVWYGSFLARGRPVPVPNLVPYFALLLFLEIRVHRNVPRCAVTTRTARAALLIGAHDRACGARAARVRKMSTNLQRSG